MPNFTAGTSFTDGVTNDVTAAKLNALVADAVPTSSLALASTTGTISNFTASTANITLGTIPTLTAGTTTGTVGVFTSGTITTGVIPTLTAGTTTSTNAVVTNGTITNLSATTSTFLGTITGSTNVVNIGSGQIYKDASGLVGIGTSSPTSVLDISKASDTSERAIKVQNSSCDLYIGTEGTSGNRFSGSSANNVFIGTTSAAGIEFATNNTVRAKIDSSGNVGIGVTSPTVKLDVSGGNIQGKEIFLENGAASSPALGTTPSWYSPASGVAALSTNANERLRIDSSGNLLVGATSITGLTPSVAAKTLVLNSTDANLSGAVSYVSNGTVKAYHYVDTDGLFAHQVISGGQKFYTNNTERLRIDSSGNCSIGTATALSKLHIHGDLTLSNATTAVTASTSTITPPATIAGYLTVSINGTSRKIPYYAT